MKINQRYTAWTLAAIIWLMACLVALTPLAALAETKAAPLTYSTTANSGVRDEVCVTLDGTGAVDYYTDGYTYGDLADEDAATLLSALRTLMTDTHTTTSVYADSRDYASKTDCQNGDGMISLLYTGYNATPSDFIGSGSVGWNREHVWPKSLGGFGNDKAGADLHHVRPDDSKTNGDRGNLKYGNADGGTTVKGSTLVDGMVGGTKKGSFFEPLDNVKGDVARICLYVYVRYGAQYSQCASITNVFESVDVLLEWCTLDPVDTWEMGRNEVVGAMQGNRNVFIDYPEYAWLLFDREVPVDMTTPSGMAKASGEVDGTESETESEIESTPASETESEIESTPASETESNTESNTVTDSDTAATHGTDGGETTEAIGGCGASMTVGVVAMTVVLPAAVVLRKRRKNE